LEFNVPFQHKYGYIRDEVFFKKTNTQNQNKTLNLHANPKRWNDETTRGHWQQLRCHSNVLAIQYHKNNVASTTQVITRHVFTLGQTSIISSQFIHKHLRKSHQICP